MLDVAALQQELSSLRQERIQARERLDALSGRTNRGLAPPGGGAIGGGRGVGTAGGLTRPDAGEGHQWGAGGDDGADVRRSGRTPWGPLSGPGSGPGDGRRPSVFERMSGDGFGGVGGSDPGGARPGRGGSGGGGWGNGGSDRVASGWPATQHAAKRGQRNARARAATMEAPTSRLQQPGKHLEQVNVVYKFGGSSVRDAERMREVADIICSFPENFPCVVLSAMGKTTNLLLECGELALHTGTEGIAGLRPLRAIYDLHMATCQELGVEAATRAEVERLLSELQQLLIGISIMQDLTDRARDSLVSFGERLSTRIFASFLRSQGVAARQWDAWQLGVTTNDDFTNAEVMYDQTLPKVKAALTRLPGGPKELPIVTGFLGRGATTGAITTLGRGGSDLTATVLGAAMELAEVQVWKDVDGVLTSDPRIVSGTTAVNALTFDEATELAFFGAQVLHPLAMQPAIRSGKMGVRVKNSYNREAPGTIIRAARDMTDTLVTSIVLKNNVTLFDIVSTRMLGQYGFLAKVFDIFRRNQVSVDVVATSEVSISLTLDPKRSWGDGEADEELDRLVYELERIASTRMRSGAAIISLICNVSRTNEILMKAFSVLNREAVGVQMISQGASKVNISLVVDGADGVRAVRALHDEFFGTQCLAASQAASSCN